MTGSYDGAVIGQRFRLSNAPTLLTRTASVAPIGFARVRNESHRFRATDVPFEAAFVAHVALRPMRVDLWMDGRPDVSVAASTGDTFMFDLSRNPVSEFHDGIDSLRFYISQASLDELGFDHGQRRAVRLDPRSGGVSDPVMFGLAQAMLGPVEQAGEQSALFIDHIGLAFHAHITNAYGATAPPVRQAPGRLAGWQLRRAIDHMTSHLEGDPTIADLAQECGLSAGYFARAFRRSAGVSPHQWLMRRRVEQARELLLHGRMELAQIAMACGFVDQSHFSRVFTKLEGESPKRWRQRHG